MANDSGQKKQDLQGWGMVFAVEQDVLNSGLKKLHDIIPPEYREVNYSHTIDSPLGLFDVTISKAALGVIQVDAIADGLWLTKVLIPIDSGKLAIKKYEKDLTGASIDSTISLAQFKATIQPTSGTGYDVHLDIESDDAVYDVKADIDPLYNEFLNAAIKGMLKGIGGKSYYICTFDVGKDYKYKDFIPSEMDYTFVFNETDHAKSVFCAVMATAIIPPPTEASRFAFNRAEVIPEGQVAAFSIHNLLFTRMLERNLKTQGKFANSQWKIVGDSPAALTLAETMKDFSDGANLQHCTITAQKGRIYVNMTLYKPDVTPGINLTFKSEVKVKLVWDADKKMLHLQVDGKPTVTHEIDESLWLTILRLIPNIVGILTMANIIIFIIEAIINDNLPDIGSMIAKELSEFEVPVKLPKILIENCVKISSIQINEYGSISAGLTIKEVQ